MRVASKTDSTDHVFSAISKEEVAPISAFLTSKNVRLRNEMDEVMDVDPISDEDIEEDISIPSEDEVKEKKGKKDGVKPKKPANGDDEESGMPLSSRMCQINVDDLILSRRRGL